MIRSLSVREVGCVHIYTELNKVEDKHPSGIVTVKGRLLPVGQHTQEYQSPWQEVPPLQQELFQEVHL